jgi:hypothetical protein
MDKKAEERFVNSYIRKERRERLLYELSTPKKRYEGISRFCHGSKELIDPSKIVMEGDGIDRDRDFTDFAARHNEICRILSPESWEEDLFLPLKDALDIASLGLDAMVIIGSRFAVVFGEPSKYGRDIFLLTDKKEK